MMFGLFAKKPKSEVPQKLYAQIVAQARREVFFTGFGFADTVMGRFDCLVMHLFLFSNRLAVGKHEYCRSLNQEVFDCFMAELETALRKIGVGDPTVPKRKKKFVRSFYGTVDDFRELMDGGMSDPLVEKVNKRFFDDKNPQGAHKLAAYMADAHETLAKITDEELLAGKLAWPEPESKPEPEPA